MRFSETCDIVEVPDGTDASLRNTVITSHPCSPIWPSKVKQKERLGLARTVNVYTIFVQPNTSIKERMRVQMGGQELKIHTIDYWPINDPEYYRLFLELD